jgi:broad specificity phosphatase PhoE
MTQFFLIRHASHDLLGNTLAGRTPGLSINARGQAEIRELATRFHDQKVHAIYSSPQSRCLETATPLAESLSLPVRTNEAINEIDFGAWTGRSFQSLQLEPEWMIWVHYRSSARIPHGETIQRVQHRVIQEMEALVKTHRDQTVILMSHADVIKTALAHCLGSTLDLLERFEIAPCSVSTIAMGDDWAQVRSLNAMPFGNF